MSNLAGMLSKRKFLIGLIPVVLLIAAIGVYFLAVRSETDASSEQPIAFNHQIHAQNGITCQFCHSGVAKSPAAGIPSVEFCMGCHSVVATDSPEIKTLAGYWERQEPIPWVRINQQPSYVYFNHQAHIAASVSCGSCHGDVATMHAAEPVVNMNMGFCLDCHAEQDNKDALYDCAVCHR
ncbi:MAG: cytochrome c3 family protein [Anaerolineae bacterium]|nr:cytochrome c3 family protein [Anaerolineae bacterium]